MEQGEVGTHDGYFNNLCFQNGAAEWSLSKNTHSGDVNADPQFMDFANGDYRLRSISPAINRGLSTYSPGNDILGVSRPQRGGFDLGAYELP